jgi:hypothetical protein
MSGAGLRMNDSRRVPLVKDGVASASDEPGRTDARTVAKPSPKSGGGQARFIGAAMKTLFESSEVSIARGDETRVMSRAQDALEKLHLRHPNSLRPGSPHASERAASTADSNGPERPRVDAVLWVVLALGLFAIAGWMIAYAL